MSTIPNERRIWRQRMRDAALRWRKYRHADPEEALAAIVAANLFERITMNVKPPKPAPDHVLRMLKTKGESRYSRFVTVFHCLEIHEGVFVGVVGDGDNGSYEWFLVEQGKLTHSDSGYGISESALRDVLINEV